MRGDFWQIKLNAENERNIESESFAYHTSGVKDLVFAFGGLCGESEEKRDSRDGFYTPNTRPPNGVFIIPYVWECDYERQPPGYRADGFS